MEAFLYQFPQTGCFHNWTYADLSFRAESQLIGTKSRNLLKTIIPRLNLSILDLSIQLNLSFYSCSIS